MGEEEEEVLSAVDILVDDDNNVKDSAYLAFKPRPLAILACKKIIINSTTWQNVIHRNINILVLFECTGEECFRQQVLDGSRSCCPGILDQYHLAV